MYNNSKKVCERNVKITNRAHAFKGFVSSDNVEILNYLKPELKRKDTESAFNSIIDSIKRF